MKNVTRESEKGWDLSFYDLSDGCILVQEGEDVPINYLIKDGKPLSQKEVVKYLANRGKVSIPEKIFLRPIGVDYVFDNYIRLSDDLVERLQKQKDLKDCFADKKLIHSYYPSNYRIPLGEIYDIEEFSKQLPDVSVQDEECQPNITFEKAEKTAENRMVDYTLFLAGLKKIKAGKL